MKTINSPLRTSLRAVLLSLALQALGLSPATAVRAASLNYDIRAPFSGASDQATGTNLHLWNSVSGSSGTWDDQTGSATVDLTPTACHAACGCSGGQNTQASVWAQAYETYYAHLRPGATGAITVAVTPYVSLDALVWDDGGWRATADLDCKFHIGGGGIEEWPRYLFDQHLNNIGGGNGGYRNDSLSTVTVPLNDGESMGVDWYHSLYATDDWGYASIISRCWYTVKVSGNGYLTTQSGAPIPTPPPPPEIKLSTGGGPGSSGGPAGGGAAMVVTGGPTNDTFVGYVLSSTNVALPMAHWTVIATNSFAADGSFTNTIPVNTNEPQRFFRLLLAP